jgi:5-methylthioadenosine/S-adenosylhomocysteine deaminase
MNMTLIQHADYVVTVDAERRIIEDGAIAVAGDKIVEVGKTDAVVARYPGARTIDARGKLAMPGLVDTHIHAAQQLGRGVGDERFSMERYLRVLWGYEAGLDSGDALCGFRLCMAELLRAGITCFADPGNYVPVEEALAV